MSGNSSFVRVPPDGTGKKLFALEHQIGGEPMQVPCHHISCSVDPNHVMLVDARGQAYTRSAEGSPTIDAWGNARTAEQNSVAVYEFSVNGMDDLFSDRVVGSGSVSHNPSKRCVVLSADSNKDCSSKRITNRYHYCMPGVGLNSTFAIMAGDSGKAGNTRMFGYGDDRNGLFFALIGNELNIIIRNDSSGEVVDTIIPQSSWNGDKLDGSGVSAFTLDPTKLQLMFIDFSWIGTGIARFGCYTQDGSRWVCHTHDNAGSSSFPFLTSGSLPVYFENTNSSSTLSSSELFVYGCTVYNSCKADYTFWRFVSDSGAPKAVSTDTPLISLKPKLQIGGVHNQVGLYPETLSVFVSGGSVYLKVIDDAILNSPNWIDEHGSTALIDKSSTSFTDGELFWVDI